MMGCSPNAFALGIGRTSFRLKAMGRGFLFRFGRNTREIPIGEILPYRDSRFSKKARYLGRPLGGT